MSEDHVLGVFRRLELGEIDEAQAVESLRAIRHRKRGPLLSFLMRLSAK